MGNEITIDTMEEIIGALSEKRKAFVSERDLQVELALMLKDRYEKDNKAIVLCEYPVRVLKSDNQKIVGNEMYIDILVILKENDKEHWTPIELKYKTKNKNKNETVYLDFDEKVKYSELKNQGARDLGCYDYLKDIKRIEIIRQERQGQFECGYTLFITNDIGYRKNEGKKCKYEKFSLYEREGESNKKQKNLNWNLKGKGAEPPKNRPNLENLEDEYTIKWKNYTKIKQEIGEGDFIYLLNEIKK